MTVCRDPLYDIFFFMLFFFPNKQQVMLPLTHTTNKRSRDNETSLSGMGLTRQTFQESAPKCSNTGEASEVYLCIEPEIPSAFRQIPQD